MDLSNKLAIPPLILLSGLISFLAYDLYYGPRNWMNGLVVILIIYLLVPYMFFAMPFLMDLDRERHREEIEQNHKAVCVSIGYIILGGGIYAIATGHP